MSVLTPAEQAIADDALVQAILMQYPTARIVPGSIQPFKEKK